MIVMLSTHDAVMCDRDVVVMMVVCVMYVMYVMIVILYDSDVMIQSSVMAMV